MVTREALRTGPLNPRNMLSKGYILLNFLEKLQYRPSRLARQISNPMGQMQAIPCREIVRKVRELPGRKKPNRRPPKR